MLLLIVYHAQVAAAAAAAAIATRERIDCNHGDGIQYGIIVASHWFGDFTLQ